MVERVVDPFPPSVMLGCWLGTITVHGEHHVFWVLQGEARVMVNGTIHVLHAREALWLPGGTAVDQVTTVPETVAFTVLVPAVVIPESGSEVRQRRITPDMCGLLVHLFSRWRMPAWTRDGLMAGAWEALRTVFFSSDGVVVDRPRMPVTTAVVDVARMLLTCPGDPRTREQWAARAGLSERHLTRLFQAETGLSFASWRTALKIATAAEEALSGERICDIAAELGYSGTAALSHAFRRHTGLTLSSVGSRTTNVDSASAPEELPGLDVLIPADSMRPNINEFHVLIGILRGSCTVVLRGRGIELEAGQLLWLPAGVWHQLKTAPGTIVLPVGNLPMRYPIHRSDMVAFVVPEDRYPEILYRSCIIFTRLRPYPMINGVMDNLLPSSVHHRMKRECQRSAVTDIIAADLRIQRTLGDWAEKLGMRTDVLARHFEGVTGQPYREWIIDRRMTVARRLLENPDRRVAEVASAVGYGSSASFVRIFKERVGMTPGQYQRRYRKRVILDVVE